MIIELRKQKENGSARQATINDTFKIVSFVLHARSHDPCRAILEYLHVEVDEAGKKVLVCTDGRRLHYSNPLDNLTFDPGFYRVLKVTPNLIWLDFTPNAGTYPDWRMVIPKHATLQTCVTMKSSHSHYDLCVQMHGATGGFYDLDLLIECLQVGTDFKRATVSCEPAKTGLDAVLITHEQGNAVLMPVRVS